MILILVSKSLEYQIEASKWYIMKLMDKAMELIVMNSIPLKIHVTSTGEIRLPYQNGDKVNISMGMKLSLIRGDRISLSVSLIHCTNLQKILSIRKPKLPPSPRLISRV